MSLNNKNALSLKTSQVKADNKQKIQTLMTKKKSFSIYEDYKKKCVGKLEISFLICEKPACKNI